MRLVKRINVDKTEAAKDGRNTCKSPLADEIQIGADCLIMLLA